MKIDLEEPYKSLYKLGYLRTNNDNRRVVDLYNSDTDRTTISYARYLMSVKLGYVVPPEFEVDHIDDDFTNDDPSNLQLLTQEENLKKENLRYIMNDMEFANVGCEWCEKPFTIPEREYKKKLNNKTGIYCSRSCNGSASAYYTNNLKSSISEIDIQRIKSLRSQGLSVYKIAAQTGFAKNTIMKYWN